MRKILAAICIVAFVVAPAGAEDAESGDDRAELFASCHGVFHAMKLLSAKGKYVKEAARNKAISNLFAKLEKRVDELALDAYEANGDEDADAALKQSADEHVAAFGELTPGGKYTRAELEEDVKSCYELMNDDTAEATDDEVEGRIAAFTSTGRLPPFAWTTGV